VAIDAYKWLISFLLEESRERLADEFSKTRCSFTSKNNSQVYYCRSLSLVFIEVGKHRHVFNQLKVMFLKYVEYIIDYYIFPQTK